MIDLGRTEIRIVLWLAGLGLDPDRSTGDGCRDPVPVKIVPRRNGPADPHPTLVGPFGTELKSLIGGRDSGGPGDAIPPIKARNNVTNPRMRTYGMETLP